MFISIYLNALLFKDMIFDNTINKSMISHRCYYIISSLIHLQPTVAKKRKTLIDIKTHKTTQQLNKLPQRGAFDGTLPYKQTANTNGPANKPVWDVATRSRDKSRKKRAKVGPKNMEDPKHVGQSKPTLQPPKASRLSGAHAIST